MNSDRETIREREKREKEGTEGGRKRERDIYR